MCFLFTKLPCFNWLAQPFQRTLALVKQFIVHHRGTLLITGVIAALCLVTTEGWAADGGVTTLTGLRSNVDKTFGFAMELLIDLGTISGFALFFLGIFSVYTSHTKQAAGGKPMSHGLVMLACGAVLIGMPYFFKIATKTVTGADPHKLGQSSEISSMLPDSN